MTLGVMGITKCMLREAADWSMKPKNVPNTTDSSSPESPTLLGIY